MVERLDANSLTVSANTESVTKAGEYNLSLSAKKNSSNSDYEIVSVVAVERFGIPCRRKRNHLRACHRLCGSER